MAICKLHTPLQPYHFPRLGAILFPINWPYDINEINIFRNLSSIDTQQSQTTHVYDCITRMRDVLTRIIYESRVLYSLS